MRIALVVWAAGLFALAGAAFQKITEYPEFKEAAEQHAGVGWSYIGVVIAAALAGIAFVLVALAVVRSRPPLRVLFVPFVALVVWVVSLPLAFLLARGQGVHSFANIAAVAVVAVLTLGVVAAIAWAANRIHVSGLPRVIFTVLAGAMAAATIACAAWGLALRAEDPAEFNTDDGLLAFSLAGSWIAMTLVMAAASTLAFLATRREPAVH
jgi:hypothetical protein